MEKDGPTHLDDLTTDLKEVQTRFLNTLFARFVELAEDKEFDDQDDPRHVDPLNHFLAHLASQLRSVDQRN